MNEEDSGLNVQASAYVKQGRLIVIGVAQLKIGPVPFTYDCPVPEGTPEGPLDMNGDHGEALEECLATAETAIHRKIKEGAVKVGAENLVLRARQGDQNAMAMLMAVRDSAKKGVPKAKVALKAIKEYIEDHPPTEECQFGSETQKNVTTALAQHVENDNPLHYAIGVITLLPYAEVDRAAVLIANGPLITSNLLQLICSSLSEREQVLFYKGYQNSGSSAKAAMFGRIFRKARELQAGRKGEFAKHSKLIAYELGV